MAGIAVAGAAILTPLALTEWAVMRGARTLRAMARQGGVENSLDNLRYRIMVLRDEEAAFVLCKRFDVTDIEEAVQLASKDHDQAYLPGAFDAVADGLNAYLSSKERKEVHA